MCCLLRSLMAMAESQPGRVLLTCLSRYAVMLPLHGLTLAIDRPGGFSIIGSRLAAHCVYVALMAIAAEIWGH